MCASFVALSHGCVLVYFVHLGNVSVRGKKTKSVSYVQSFSFDRVSDIDYCFVSLSNIVDYRTDSSMVAEMSKVKPLIDIILGVLSSQ